MAVKIRPLSESDIPRWTELRKLLWPQESVAELDSEGRASLAAVPPLVVFLADDDSAIIGFLELGLRSVADGCLRSPVPFVEGWYVAEEWRRQGVGSSLMKSAEVWSRDHGYSELGSNTEDTNRLSREAHAALGFSEMETVVMFRKPL